MEKNELRQQMLTRRKNLTDKEVREASDAFLSRLSELPLLKKSQVILSYMPYGREADILPLNRWIIEQGKVLCVPRVLDSTHMDAVQVNSLEKDLVKSAFGIWEPSRDLKPQQPEKIDLILVPGLAFDRQGNRLGHGRGYYDRFLEGISKDIYTIGIAYSFQVLDHIPYDAHDRRMDSIVTENEILIFKTPRM